MKFLHAADLHLGAPFRSVQAASPQIAVMLAKAVRTAVDRMTDLALRECVDFVVICGDIFHSDETMQASQIHFRENMGKLNSAEIPVYLICGNHDPLMPGSKRISLPANCHLFPADTARCCRVVKNGEILAEIAGISYRAKNVGENLALHYPSPSADCFSIALLHGNLTGSREPHENYAPFSLDDLASKGYHYWALGHIHKPQQHKLKNGIAVYPGSIQGLDPTETGEHGCMLVETDQKGIADVQFHPLCPVQWEQHRLTSKETDRLQITDLLDTLYETVQMYKEKAEESRRSIALRIQLDGRTPLYHETLSEGFRKEVLNNLQESEPHEPFVWVEQIEWNLRPDIDLQAMETDPSYTGEVARQSLLALSSPELLGSLFGKENAGVIWDGMPWWLQKEFADTESQKRLLEKARDMALDMLLAEEN